MLKVFSRIGVPFHWKHKQTTDMAKGLHHFIGKEQAKEVYMEEEIMDPTTFNSVNWENFQDSLTLKPKMYQL